MKRWRSTACNDLITLDKPDALLFDMDGLLLDTERLFMESLIALLVPRGFSAHEVQAFFLTLVGTSSAHTTRALQEFVGPGHDIGELDREWRDLHRAKMSDGVPFRPHVKEVLPQLRAAGFRIAVVTSTSRAGALHHLEKAQILDLFDLIIGGDEVSRNKPDPMPYLMAAERLGVDPRRCAAFEDSDLGTMAAVRAGCITTQIPDLRPLNTPLPDLGQAVAPDLRAAVMQLGLLPEPVAR